MPGRLYCTYFDHRYLARGFAMLRSLHRHDPDATILVMALDEQCEQALRQAPPAPLRILSQAALLAANPDLAALAETRDAWAFYATHKPVFIQAAFASQPPGTAIIFVDADTWFFSSPSPALAELTHASIGLSPHRFSPGHEQLAKYGTYNAGFLFFRVDQEAARCLTDWRQDCLDWCQESPQPDGRFMNQGYLNRWPARYSGVYLIQHPGINLAPWNADRYYLEPAPDAPLVDRRPVIFYHYSQTYRDPSGLWYSLGNYFQRQRQLFLTAIYHPYIEAVEAESRSLQLPPQTLRDVVIPPGATRLNDHPRPPPSVP